MLLAAFAAAVLVGVAVTWGWAVAGVSSAAADLDEIDLAIGSAGLVRSSTNQALIHAIDQSNGTSSEAAVATSVESADETVAKFETYAAAVARAGSEPGAGGLVGLVDSARAVLDAINANDLDAAMISWEAVGPAYAAATGELGAARADAISRIEAASALPAWLEGAARIAVTLAIPGVLAIFFWIAMRRRVRSVKGKAKVRIEQLESELERANRSLESLAVRFRTPLTSIYGLSDLLVQKHRTQDLERELITLLHTESAELTRIADDALAATQIAAGSLTASTSIVAFAELVEEAIKPIRSTGVEVKVECPEIWVLTDPTKARQIVRNLVSNAATHGEEPVFVEVSESNGVVECDIIDHGTKVASGVRSDQVDFDPATGLGLKVAYELADVIGAKLEHYRDGDRTRFTLSLIEEDDTAPAATGEKRRILRRLPRPLPPQQDAPTDSAGAIAAAIQADQP